MTRSTVDVEARSVAVIGPVAVRMGDGIVAASGALGRMVTMRAKPRSFLLSMTFMTISLLWSVVILPSARGTTRLACGALLTTLWQEHSHFSLALIVPLVMLKSCECH